MDLSAGAIYRFKNYTFEDDQSQRDKYTIILHSSPTETVLIHSLTTSQNKLNVPELHYGCTVYNERFPYFFFPSGAIIGDQNFSFSKNTFIFFANNIRKERVEKFEKAAKQVFGLTYLGKLFPEELKRIIKCALKSKLITKDIEAVLLDVKNRL
jgi:hypothetical protein